MRAAAKIYKKEGGVLKFVDSGECEMYVPQQTKPSKYVPPHVTIAIGEFRLHIDRSAFLQFCKGLLYNGVKNGLSLLR